jgi:Suppressor of fused protein (SUFU)
MPRTGTINWHEPIAQDSVIDAFVIASSAELPPERAIVHLSDDDHVEILRAVPVYASELPFKREAGFDEWSRLVGANCS